MPMMRAMSDGSQEWRWVQQVFVVRGDTIAKYETDFGPEANFEMVMPLAIFGFGDDTVAEMQDAANRNRVDFYWRKRAKEMQEASTLYPDLLRQFEQKSAIIKNRTVAGPYVTTQRNGYSHTTAERNLMALKRQRSGKVQK